MANEKDKMHVGEIYLPNDEEILKSNSVALIGFTILIKLDRLNLKKEVNS